LKNDIVYDKCEFVTHIYHIKHHKNSIIKRKSQERANIYVRMGIKYLRLSSTNLLFFVTE